MNFDIITNDEFERIFLNIIGKGSKDNTYKFAMARFLLDYCNDNTETHVDFSTIAGYFLEYYWAQICKLKMKHAPQVIKKPEIVKIIEKEFPKQYYPQTFKEIKIQEPKKIQNCITQITKLCFHDVIWRFQRVKAGRAVEARVFFDYKIFRVKHANRKYIDLEYGINLNPDAIKFFKKHTPTLLKAVILEWARFLEKMNIGLPKIIAKTEGKNITRRSLTKYRQLLEPFFANCFYCEQPLVNGRDTHVEHVIPFDYIAEDDIWNLTLACRECNCNKLGSLPHKKDIKKLIQRNEDYVEIIPELGRSLTKLDQDFKKIIKNHYENAMSHGYMVWKRS